MVKKTSVRKVINTLHLWVGLPSAVILFIVCLSGTIYVFNKEITKWADSEKFYVVPPDGAQTLPVQQLVNIVERSNKGKRVLAITIPAAKNEAWIFSVGDLGPQKRPAGMGGGEQKPPQKKERLSSYLINPYTGNIQGNAQTTTSRFFNTVLEMHRWLLMEHKTGSVITGVAAILFLFLELTGLLLWLPPRMKTWKKWNVWKQGLTIKRSAHWKRKNHDLHRSLGFYSFAVITLLASTGPVLGLEWYKKGFNKLLGVDIARKSNEGTASVHDTVALSVPLSVDQWLARADSIYHFTGDVRITLPRDNRAVVTIAKTHTARFSSSGPDRLTLDQYSNAVIKNEIFADKKMNAKISALVKDIHTGEVFGLFSKSLYFVACLIATSLPVTGSLIWMNKRRKSAKVSRYRQPAVL